MEIKAKLSRASLSSAASKIRAYAGKLPAKADRIAADLADVAQATAAAAVPVDTGGLKSSIHTEHASSGRNLVVADSPYAAFVEFGTGVRGSGTYPGPVPVPWAYDSRQTPEAHNDADPSTWYFYDEDEGAVGKTRGQRASAFMAQGAEAARQAVRETAQAVMKK